MKTGLIVYVVGDKTRDVTFDEHHAARALGVAADRVDFVFSGEGEESLVDVWLDMTSKGMAKIECLAGEMVHPSMVRLTGRQLRLSGV